MGKMKKRKTTIQELKESRTGGQVALRGFAYQFLYSCYLILSTNDVNTVFHLEGIEDIDKITVEKNSNKEMHIQLKFSTIKQSAGFLKSVLKNFLEAYLIDKNREFKLVYDFDVANGDLSKILSNKLDSYSNNKWKNVISEIEEENAGWNWRGFSYENFMKVLHFERKKKEELCVEIEKLLIDNYEIMTDNIVMYANALKIRCLEKMEQRGSINKDEVDILIASTTDNISKGTKNPAHGWIRKVIFDYSDIKNTDFDYYEGKKPSFNDILRGLPVEREVLESEIKKSIESNRVTVIKASSGQGKTTLAMKVAYSLREQYSIYQLLWCNDRKEILNIISYFDIRVKMGEKPLIIIDNLDSEFSEWNDLAKLLQENVKYHYKLIITTREDDWYNYSGDISGIKALQVIKLSLEEKEAKEIYEVLSKAGKLHPSIKDWRKSFRMVEKNKLLIEYIYLLTHGEMLAERINSQIVKLNNTDTGKIKCDILRKVCFADICGIRISVNKLIGSLTEKTSKDYGEILKSIENEFFIKIDDDQKYIEGLHPVRSQHIIDRLHEFIELESTALQVVSITDAAYYAKLFAYFPKLIRDKEIFYLELVDNLWQENDLSCYVDALHGVFSGSIMQYYLKNKNIYDDANEHSGLYLIDMELNPFTKFEEIGEDIKTLDKIQEIFQDNENIKYLINLRNNTKKIELEETDIFYLSKALYKRLKFKEMFNTTSDIYSYSVIAYWLIKIDPLFNLSDNISLELLCNTCSKYSIDTLTSLMYTCFLGNRTVYIEYVNNNIESVLKYLRDMTGSLKIYIDKGKNEVYVNYILLPSEIGNGNEESVSRLNYVCKMLPIFSTYCADAIKPNIDILSFCDIPDDAHKTIPLRNLVIGFHREFASLWSKTVLSNYESDSVYDWLEYWFSIRSDIVNIYKDIIVYIEKVLQKKIIIANYVEIKNIKNNFVFPMDRINKKISMEYRYPFEDRPFDEKANLPEGFGKIKRDFFQSIVNFNNQFLGLLSKDKDKSRLALINLHNAILKIEIMQEYFGCMHFEHKILVKENQELCINEKNIYQELIDICMYYKEHAPNKYFNKFQVKTWNKKIREDKLIAAENALKELVHKYYVSFPYKDYFEDVLSYYPIMIKNFNIFDINECLNMLKLCIPFAELEYTYLIVIFYDENSIVKENGLKIPKTYLKTLRESIESGEDKFEETRFSNPLPVEITTSIMSCFEGKYFIEKNTIDNSKLEHISELLWAISKSRQILMGDEDKEYLFKLEYEYKRNVEDILRSIKGSITNDKYLFIENLCKEVFKGAIFLDSEISKFYEYLISSADIKLV